MQNFDWADVLYFEPWFGIMGVLLIGSSLCARGVARVAPAGNVPSTPAWMRRASWARPVSIAVLGLAALAHLAWATGTNLLLPARADDTPRLVELGQIGSCRLVDGVAAVLLAALAAAVARLGPPAGAAAEPRSRWPDCSPPCAVSTPSIPGPLPATGPR